MISTRDLRPGNLLMDIYSNKYEVVEISSRAKLKFWSFSEDKFVNLPLSKLKPIPLTSKLIVDNCGFTKTEVQSSEGYIDSGCEFLWDPYIGRLYHFGEVDGAVWLIGPCNFLHELQNRIYWSSYNQEELNIEL